MSRPDASATSRPCVLVVGGGFSGVLTALVSSAAVVGAWGTSVVVPGGDQRIGDFHET